MTVIVVLVLAVCVFVGARRGWKQGRAQAKHGGRPLVRTEAGPACPHCGGHQFRAKRSAAGKAALGVLATKTKVECVTCGVEYNRG